MVIYLILSRTKFDAKAYFEVSFSVKPEKPIKRMQNVAVFRCDIFADLFLLVEK